MGATNRQHRLQFLATGALIATLGLSAIAPAAQAQRITEPNRSNRDAERPTTGSRDPQTPNRATATPIQTIPEAFHEAFFDSNKDAIFDNSIGGQFSTLLGLPFPDSGTARDARRITELHREVMYLQNTADPVMRTDDYPNPYNSSLLEALRSEGTGGGVGPF
ncbi:MAG: hypothetical protein Fur0042_01170 [Cyanophyceae cyanobacterium]